MFSNCGSLVQTRACGFNSCENWSTFFVPLGYICNSDHLVCRAMWCPQIQNANDPKQTLHLCGYSHLFYRLSWQRISTPSSFHLWTFMKQMLSFLKEKLSMWWQYWIKMSWGTVKPDNPNIPLSVSLLYWPGLGHSWGANATYFLIQAWKKLSYILHSCTAENFSIE